MKASSVEVGQWYFTRLGMVRPIQIVEDCGPGFYYQVYGKSHKSPLYLSNSEIEAVVTRKVSDMEMQAVEALF